MVKCLPANAGETGDVGSIPGSGKCPGGINGNPLQYSCLENHMDRGAWWAIVHRVEKESDTTERLSTYIMYIPYLLYPFIDGHFGCFRALAAHCK